MKNIIYITLETMKNHGKRYVILNKDNNQYLA